MENANTDIKKTYQDSFALPVYRKEMIENIEIEKIVYNNKQDIIFLEVYVQEFLS